MGILRKLEIVKGENLIAGRIFEELFPSFFDIKYQKPSDYINKTWTAYESVKHEKVKVGQEKNINGKIFEIILSTLLVREEITPIFINSKIAFVPNINYDIILCSEEKGPICLSAKTSCRERYKQADLEAQALKNVHRKSLSFLITLSEKDASDINKKIDFGDVMGLNKIIYARNNDFDEFMRTIKQFKFIDSPVKKVIESNQIITSEKIKNLK